MSFHGPFSTEHSCHSCYYINDVQRVGRGEASQRRNSRLHLRSAFLLPEKCIFCTWQAHFSCMKLAFTPSNSSRALSKLAVFKVKLKEALIFIRPMSVHGPHSIELSCHSCYYIEDVQRVRWGEVWFYRPRDTFLASENWYLRSTFSYPRSAYFVLDKCISRVWDSHVYLIKEMPLLPWLSQSLHFPSLHSSMPKTETLVILLTSFCFSLGPTIKFFTYSKSTPYLRRSPYLLFWRETYPQTFPLSSCQYLSTIPEKNCMLPTFEKLTLCRGLCGENDRPSI